MWLSFVLVHCSFHLSQCRTVFVSTKVHTSNGIVVAKLKNSKFLIKKVKVVTIYVCCSVGIPMKMLNIRTDSVKWSKNWQSFRLPFSIYPKNFHSSCNRFIEIHLPFLRYAHYHHHLLLLRETFNKNDVIIDVVERKMGNSVKLLCWFHQRPPEFSTDSRQMACIYCCILHIHLAIVTTKTIRIDFPPKQFTALVVPKRSLPFLTNFRRKKKKKHQIKRPYAF